MHVSIVSPLPFLPGLTACFTLQLNATRKEIVDTDALIERYRKEIEELKGRLAEREREVTAPKAKRRLSEREKLDENKAMHDLSSRIKQLTRLILTQNNVGDPEGEVRRILNTPDQSLAAKLPPLSLDPLAHPSSTST